jgi:probable F420-dependent oxidoreductase
VGRLGLATAQYGACATADAVYEVAETAEKIGYDTLWVGERLLAPVDPIDGYGLPGNPWPAEFATFLDPLVVLSAVAARTHRIGLGTNVLVAPLHVPVRLARELASLSVLSSGRLAVGLGLGWSRQEYAAAGVPWAARGARLEECLDVLAACWSAGPVSHDGPLWRIDPSRQEPRPVRAPRVHLAGFAPAALDRVARRADGWLPAGLPLPLLASLWTSVRERAAAYGRDPSSLELVVRVNAPVRQAVPYAEEAFRLGASEVLLDLHQFCAGPGELLDQAAVFYEEMTLLR